MKRTRLFPSAALAATAMLACGCDNPTEPPAEAPAQYISVRRAWRPGERDSVAEFVVRTGAWGQYSDLAPMAVWAWDSTTDVILNPAWRSPAAAAAGLQLAPQFTAGWGTAGVDIRIVFDSIPGGTVQKDSIDWVMTFWWNPADETWRGDMTRATTDATFSTYQTVNTAAFDASFGKSGVGGGETRVASGTYWEANGGRYRITRNDTYGGLSRITSGPFLGGNIQFGQMRGRLDSIAMPRIMGTDLPTTQKFTYDFLGSSISSQRMFCYFAPVPTPSGYTQCTGQAFANIIAAARAGRAIETLSGPLPRGP
jgi:hypothetical protein